MLNLMETIQSQRLPSAWLPASFLLLVFPLPPCGILCCRYLGGHCDLDLDLDVIVILMLMSMLMFPTLLAAFSVAGDHCHVDLDERLSLQNNVDDK